MLGLLDGSLHSFSYWYVAGLAITGYLSYYFHEVVQVCFGMVIWEFDGLFCSPRFWRAGRANTGNSSRIMFPFCRRGIGRRSGAGNRGCRPFWAITFGSSLYPRSRTEGTSFFDLVRYCLANSHSPTWFDGYLIITGL